jgi:methylglutaconyl-CoA hydratase
MKESASATFEENHADAERLAKIFGGIADFPKPLVGRIHGSVFGGGTGMTCACDITVATDDAKFGLTESRLGIIPGVISPYVIRRLGDRYAREYMLTGERFGADVALRIGLVHYVVPVHDLDTTVAERVGELLKAGPDAQRRIKSLLTLYGDSPWEEYRAGLPRALADIRSGDEAREGLAAFFEKRKPRWMS